MTDRQKRDRQTQRYTAKKRQTDTEIDRQKETDRQKEKRCREEGANQTFNCFKPI